MRIELEKDKSDGPQREPKRFRFIIHAEAELTDEDIFSGWEEIDEEGDPIPRDFELSPMSLQEIATEIKERYHGTLELANNWDLQEHFNLEVHPVQASQQSQGRGS